MDSAHHREEVGLTRSNDRRDEIRWAMDTMVKPLSCLSTTFLIFSSVRWSMLNTESVSDDHAENEGTLDLTSTWIRQGRRSSAAEEALEPSRVTTSKVRAQRGWSSQARNQGPRPHLALTLRELLLVDNDALQLFGLR